ncbi:RNA-directed DNA polymerase from mobile element jockey [Trichonephila clavipes]|nr:RNA-directed DNA polymerase from mobile element jockey [Trichonephila clavipes]
MPLSRMENTTFAMPSIIDSHDMGLRTVYGPDAQKKTPKFESLPQGSLFGPLLFNIYINDMPTHPQTSTNIYADDTVTLATYKNHNTITLALNNHLYLLQNFFDTWKIKINVDKTVAVLFTRRKTQPTPPTLYSTQLQWSQSTKYLGLILDKKKLTWKQHLTHKRDKFRKALRALYPLIGWNSLN